MDEWGRQEGRAIPRDFKASRSHDRRQEQAPGLQKEML